MADEETKQAAATASAERRVERLDALMRRFGIDSALIGIPKLARALGMGSSTLYTYMRCGTFFMPYRMVNGTPMVKVDDFIDWYLATDGDVQPRANTEPKVESAPASHQPQPIAFATPTKRGRKSRNADSAHQVEFKASDVANKGAADAAVDSVVASVLARMERQRRQSKD